MIELNTFTFYALGVPHKVEAASAVAAFGIINERLGVASFPQGVWMETGHETARAYRWTPGNFLD